MSRFHPSSRAPEDLPLAAALVGDPAAWAVLLRRYQLPLYTYAQELLHHETAALDVVQDAFIAAHRHLPALREDARFGSWLFGIAHQKIVQHWRRSGREEPLDSEALAATPDEDAPDPRDRVLRAELARDPLVPAPNPPLAIPAPAAPPLGCLDFSVNAPRHA